MPMSESFVMCNNLGIESNVYVRFYSKYNLVLLFNKHL